MVTQDQEKQGEATQAQEENYTMQERRALFLKAAEARAQGYAFSDHFDEMEVPEEGEEVLEDVKKQTEAFVEHAETVADHALDVYQKGLEQDAENKEKREEELATERGRLRQDVSVAFPNFWEKYAPTWLGGWSEERLNETKGAREAAGYIEKPNIWERYAPSFLGGWTGEEVEKYDTYMSEKTGKKKEESDDKKEGLSGWDRYAPTWLGGKDDVDIAAHDLKQENATEVFKGVTVGELREKYSDEQIHSMQMMTAKATNRQLEAEAAQNPMGLINRFHQCAEPVQLTEADYQSIGLNRQDMAAIYQMSQNDR